MVKILFFGKLGDRVGKHEEAHNLPSHIQTVQDLKTWLDAQHSLEGALFDPSIKTMMDKQIVHADSPIGLATEIGFLPPVGGG